MKYELLHLKQFFPNLGTQSGDPLVKVYLPDNLTEMGRGGERRPCLIVCPGGAYEFCSQREAEPIAFHFLPEGFNVFVLLYSVAPHHYPAQQCEAAALIELINQNADIWHCDTGRIVLMGFSAGGHLAAQYYWNNLYRKRGDTARYRLDIPDAWALEIIPYAELSMLKSISKEG